MLMLMVTLAAHFAGGALAQPGQRRHGRLPRAAGRRVSPDLRENGCHLGHVACGCMALGCRWRGMCKQIVFSLTQYYKAGWGVFCRSALAPILGMLLVVPTTRTNHPRYTSSVLAAQPATTLANPL